MLTSTALLVTIALVGQCTATSLRLPQAQTQRRTMMPWVRCILPKDQPGSGQKLLQQISTSPQSFSSVAYQWWFIMPDATIQHTPCSPSVEAVPGTLARHGIPGVPLLSSRHAQAISWFVHPQNATRNLKVVMDLVLRSGPNTVGINFDFEPTDKTLHNATTADGINFAIFAGALQRLLLPHNKSVSIDIGAMYWAANHDFWQAIPEMGRQLQVALKDDLTQSWKQWAAPPMLATMATYGMNVTTATKILDKLLKHVPAELVVFGVLQPPKVTPASYLSDLLPVSMAAGVNGVAIWVMPMWDSWLPVMSGFLAGH